MRTDEVELGFRRRRIEQIIEAYSATGDLDALVADAESKRAADRPQALEIRDGFMASRDAESFKLAMDSWARQKPHFGFGGPNGAMFLNQLVNDSEEAAIATLLSRLLTPPADEGSASKAIGELVDHTERLREQGSAAAVGRVPYLLSWFWALERPSEWPVIWPSAERALQTLGFLPSGHATLSQDDRYVEFKRVLDSLGGGTALEQILGWVGSERPRLGLDITVSDRVARAGALEVEVDESSSAERRDAYELNRTNVEVLLATVRHAGEQLAPTVEAAVGYPVKARVPGPYWVPERERLRQDAWVAFRPRLDVPTAGLRLVVGSEGVSFGLYTYHRSNGAGYAEWAVRTLSGSEPEGTSWLQYGPWGSGPPEERPSAVLLGRRLGLEVAADADDLARFVHDTCLLLKPALEAVIGGEASVVAPAFQTEPVSTEDFAGLKEEFIAETGYPSADDLANQQARGRMAELLAREALPALPIDEFRRMYNSSAYGNPGPQSILNTELRDGGDEAYNRVLQAIDHLLWDEETDLGARIDRVLDERDLGLRGFKEAVIMKLLAIADPDNVLPVFPFAGDRGKAAMLRMLDLAVPPLSASAGSRQVESNGALRGVGETLFPGDPWAQTRFFFWLLDREGDGAGADVEPESSIADALTEAAADLHLPVSFLERIVGLLRQHRQVIFYGPPGTGKTFVAMKLAEALAPDPGQRAIVQFHASTSYEDFFEGYRPDPTVEGEMRYRLTPGPLRTLAEEAAATPNQPHILVIDEINRADLARVLGELLFLLEYRKTKMSTLYRPGEPFELPENLWVIGTMNTADRSIALVDVALRRRFQFVPFILDDREENPIAGLLRQWAGPDKAWVADLVDAVNQQLRRDLGGDHLLLGPTYFMLDQIDKDSLRQVWAYQIEPLIEDLFFGEPERARPYRFEAVWARYGPPAAERQATAE